MKTVVQKFAFIAVLALLMGACKNEKKENKEDSNVTEAGFSLSGTVKYMKNGTLEIGYDHDSVYAIDTIPVVNGKFSYEGKVAFPHVASIGFSGNEVYPTSFFLENTKMTLAVDTSKTNSFQFTGSELQDEYASFRERIAKPFEDKIAALYGQMETIEDDEERGKVEEQANNVMQEMYEAIDSYAYKHPNSIVAANAILERHSYAPKVSELEKSYDIISGSIKESVLGEKIVKLLAKARKTAVGQPSMDLTINDTDGNPITLSDLKGKYVFLDFWASWCAPCRAENPNVKKAYAKYKSKGFEIYAVSLDIDKNAWLEAIAEDGLPWLHVSDLKDNNEAAELYGVQAVPMNYLINPEGVIIAKDLGGQSLMKKLEEVL